MTSIIGLKPPLHRRFNEAKSLEYIRDRYRGMKGKFDSQLATLRADKAFLERCAKPYFDGYKDWHILSAVFNHLMRLESIQRNIDLGTNEGQTAYKRLADEVKDLSFSASDFDGPEWEFAFTMHAVTCLARYGFEQRTAAMRPELAVNFLRDRMRHFDLDIPHQPMFGLPLGDWPEV
ncbi:MAG: hypothetical protein ACREIF_16265 [Chthoniobacterales bacterium]